MKLLTKQEFKQLMEQFPNGGIVFYTRDDDLMVTDGPFGARMVIPCDGEVFDTDFDIENYRDTANFQVYDNNDVLQMIQTLISGLKIELKDWFED